MCMFSAMCTLRSFGSPPLRLQQSGGFQRSELRRVERLVEENVEELLRAWNEFFSDKN